MIFCSLQVTLISSSSGFTAPASLVVRSSLTSSSNDTGLCATVDTEQPGGKSNFKHVRKVRLADDCEPARAIDEHGVESYSN